MNSKEVNKYIKKLIWPSLKQAGFSKFTARSAWRYSEETIDVLCFQSFSAYNADIMGVTPHSFAVKLGCFPTYIENQYPLNLSNGKITPKEHECYFRGSLMRTIDQPNNSNEIVWYIGNKELSVEESLADALMQINHMAFRWFERLSSVSEIQSILQNSKEDMIKLWGFGNTPSPIRSYLSGFVAYKIGDIEEARVKFAEAVSSGCFEDKFSTVEEALDLANKLKN